MSAVRQEVRYQRLREAENDDQEEVTVHLYSHSSRHAAQAQCRDAALRICASLLLLGVALGFVLYELEYGSVEPSSPQQSLGPPWNISTLESSSDDHHEAHHHSEEVTEEDEDHEQSGGPPAGHSHSAGTYHHAAAVTDSASCSGVARDVVRSGGSVVDAGVAAVLCLAVVHCHTVSLGGIFSSIYFNGTSQNASVLNAIPSGASTLAYGVPTVLQGLWSLHQQHGRKPWVELFSPAIHLASRGFLVDSSLHTALEKNQVKVLSSEGLRGLFYHQNLLKGVGASVVNAQLGNVLEIARTMTDPALPELLVHKLLNDLEVADRDRVREALPKVQVQSADPVRVQLDGLTLFSTAAPTAGTILAKTVRDVYQKYKDKASVFELLSNASKSMYTMAGVWPRGPWDLAPVGSNVIVADSAGDMVLISLTLNSTFGSGFVSPSTGILLSDFVQGAVAPGALSFWAASSVFVADNDVMGIAARGGSSLPFTLAHVLISHVLLQMDLTESINGTLTDLVAATADPWLQYIHGPAPGTVMAIEVRAEHVHVSTAGGCLCHPAGL